MRKALFNGLVITAVFCAAITTTPALLAAEPASNSFRFDESVIGAGGLVQSQSNSFRGDSSTGDLGVGESSSANFQVQAGSVTTNDPSLGFAVINPIPTFTNFSASTPSTATTQFSVKNYTAYGYVVNVLGSVPSNGTSEIDAMSGGGNSTPGTEQFGLNLVANTQPSSLGANPLNDAQGTTTFGFGQASTNYNTPNSYRFVSGETIAQAPKSSGLTTYTISYLINVAGLTPGGVYKSDQTLIVTGTY